MGILDGGVASIFDSVFSGFYLDAILHAGTGEPIYGPGGVIIDYAGGDIPVKAQVDSATDAMRRSVGFAEGDVRIIVLAGAPPVEINSDHEITVRGVKYSLQTAELDAASSHYVCRGRKKPNG